MSSIDEKMTSHATELRNCRRADSCVSTAPESSSIGVAAIACACSIPRGPHPTIADRSTGTWSCVFIDWSHAIDLDTSSTIQRRIGR
jgi:hypothetical protein